MKNTGKILILLVAAVLFLSVPMSAMGAPSPEYKLSVTITTEDGIQVSLWRMPDYLDKLSEKARKKCMLLMQLLEPNEVLYFGEVTAGKAKGSSISMVESVQGGSGSQPAADAGVDRDLSGRGRMKNIAETAEVSTGTRGQLQRSRSGIFMLSSDTYAGTAAASLVRGIVDHRTVLAAGTAGTAAAAAGQYLKGAALVSEIRSDLNAAYAEIEKTKNNLNRLHSGISAKAAAAGVPLNKCKITEVFELTIYKDSDELEKNNDIGKISISIQVMGKNATNFVCLLHRNQKKWEIVENAAASANMLKFSVDSLSSFAIVTWSGGELGTAARQSPKTGDNTGALLAAAFVPPIFAVFLGISIKKRKNIDRT